MKKIFILLFILSVVANIILIGYVGYTYYKNRKNRDIFRFNEYAYANSKLSVRDSNENRVVFIGNSITENWVHLRYKYFVDNDYICRGIGGQTSPLLLLRFRSDVIDLKPKAVVINAGINDIAENTSTYDPDFTLNNIKSMAQLAEANNIKVILTSLLPCNSIEWKSSIKNIPEKIYVLNENIKVFAKENDFQYVDYYTSMVDENKGLKDEYSLDGLHPNRDGYIHMEAVIDPVIKLVLEKN